MAARTVSATGLAGPTLSTPLDDRFALTSTEIARWHVLSAEFNWFAQLAMPHTVVKALGNGIALSPLRSIPKSTEDVGRKELVTLGLPMPNKTVR